MTLGDALAILRARWRSVAVVTVLATLIAAAAAFLIPPTYAGTTGIFVATREVDNPEQAYAAGRFAQERVSSYRDLITSEALATRTAARLQLKESPRELARRVRATVNPDSVLIKVSVTHSSPATAVDLANAVTEDFVHMVDELEAPVAGRPPVTQVIVVKNAKAAVWVGPDRQKIVGFGLLGGLLLGGVLALALSRREPKESTPVATPTDDSNTDVEHGTTVPSSSSATVMR